MRVVDYLLLVFECILEEESSRFIHGVIPSILHVLQQVILFARRVMFWRTESRFLVVAILTHFFCANGFPSPP